ncbi:MAG: DUF748 domain-containing protein [Gammaproteobacteria bacterium]|nr:DUF748 domain-containing protein [Gammaproteobacteria bacterium]
MPSLPAFLTRRRWPLWLLAVLVLLYGLYVALAYLYLPGKLKDVVQTDVAQMLGREITVEKIAFNPFALALTVENFSIADRPQQPLLAWQRVFVDLGAWGSLFGWQVKLEGVQLDGPHIAIERRKTDFNFSDILHRLATNSAAPEPQAAEETPGKPLAIRIDDIRILDGIFSIDDTSGSKPARSEVDNIDIGVQNLYLATGDDRLNPFHVRAKVPGGGALDLSGEYRVDPLQVNCALKANGIRLAKFADFVENQVPLKVAGGTLGFSLQLQMTQQERVLQVLLRDGQVELADLALDDSVTEPPLLRAGKISANGIELDLAQQDVKVAQVRFDSIDSHLWRDAQGVLRFAPLLPAPAADNATAPASSPAQEKNPWKVQIADVQLAGSSLTFLDQTNGMAAQQTLSDLSLQLKDVRLEEGAQVPLTLTARLNDSGTLQLNGNLTPSPFALQLQYQLQALSLLPFNPYVQASTHLQLLSGELDVNGDLNMPAGDEAPMTLNMKVDVRDLAGNDTRTGKSLLQWQALTLNPLQLDLKAKRLSIDNVTLAKPDLTVEIAADKQVNLATLMKPFAEKEADSTADPAAEPEQPWQFSIGQIRVEQGNTRLRDDSINPVFKTSLTAMDVSLGELRSSGGKPVPFELQAKLDRYAPLSIKGTLAPLDQQPGFIITNRLQGLDMPSLSPYTGTYIGHTLRSGKLVIESRYELKERQLNGKSHIVARNLYLGDPVASELAVDAPVGLGLALLRDNRGVIDLDLAVSGNLDDPGFSVFGLVGKALLNILVKAATSPFQLLGSLAGGREDLGEIEFAAGSAQLDDAGQEKLRQLAKALAERSEIGLNVNGNALMAEDGPALQRQRVMELVAAERGKPADSFDPANWLDDEDNRDELEDLADDLDLADADDREDELRKSQPDLQDAALQQAVFQLMWADVAARQSVAQQELKELAEQRAQAIKQFLVEEASFDHERIDLPVTAAGGLSGRICALALEPQ